MIYQDDKKGAETATLEAVEARIFTNIEIVDYMKYPFFDRRKADRRQSDRRLFDRRSEAGK